MATGSSDPSSLDCFASPPRRAPLDDLSNIQKALLDVERTPDRGINVAEGWQGKHDLTPISKTEALPPLKRTKSKQRSGSTKRNGKKLL